jgi:cystathionine beta-lyase
MPDSEFDRIINRRETESAKWNRYGQDVLPLWVADMDFYSPEPVIRALRQRVDHGVYGYPAELPELRPVVVERLERLYGWQVEPDALVFVPGVVVGFNLAIQACAVEGDGVLVQTPVYYPMLYAPANANCTLDEMQLTEGPDGQYEVDYDLFEETATDRTRVFLLCNPHNPVGRVFRREELEQMAEICLRHDMIICSDEIHCDLVFSEHRHIPIATLSPEVEARTITLIAPSKTYNIAGLHCSVAVIPDDDLRKRFQKATRGLTPRVGLLGQVAGLAAYRDGQPWLDRVMAYLEANRDYLVEQVGHNLPGVSMLKPEGTYLGWLDCRQAGIPGSCYEFFLETAHVALNDGAAFGQGGAGFLRLNFGCPRSTLDEALTRMMSALASL